MIYFDDFERTEDSDSIQAVIGRALIVGTRFENLCKHTYKLIVIQEKQIEYRMHKLLSDNPDAIDKVYNKFFDDTFGKFVSLLKSIKGLELPNDYADVLESAKNARNELVHSATIGLEGCIEIKLSEGIEILLSEIKKLVSMIAEGDYLISTLLTQMNKDEMLSPSHAESYKANIVNWVMEL